MRKMTLLQIVTPLVTLAIICFMYFGPITRTPFENIIISIIIIIANYFEYLEPKILQLHYNQFQCVRVSYLFSAKVYGLSYFQN